MGLGPRKRPAVNLSRTVVQSEVPAVDVYWMNNSESMARKHYLQITDDHLKADCGFESDRQVVALVGATSHVIAPQREVLKSPTGQNKAFPVTDHHEPSQAFCAWTQVGDERLERFSYYSIKDEVSAQPPEQVVANTVTNPTLSETVALLIESWSRMTPRQKAWLSTWLQQ
jgi:hypothetical protein